MTARPWFVAALTVGALAAWTPLQPPTTRHYKVEFHSAQVVDLTALGQGEQKNDFSASAFLGVTLADSADGQAVTMLLDSLVPGEGSPIPAEVAKTFAGTTWHGYRDAKGKLGELVRDGDNQAADQIMPFLRTVLPPVRAGVKEGTNWTDTTETGAAQGLGVRTVTNYAASSATVDGAKVLQVAGASSSAISGEQQSPQGALSIEGTGSSTSTWLVAPDGTCLSAKYSGTQDLAVSGSFAPEPIPVKVQIEGTSSLLK